MSNERGIALLIVLTVVTLLTIAVIEFTYSVQLGQHRARNSVNALQAQLLARSGVNVAESFLARDQDATFDAFTEEWWQEMGVFCQGLQLDLTTRLKCDAVDESGKININLTQPARNRPQEVNQDGELRTKDALLRDALRQIFEKYEIDVQIPDRLKEYWLQDAGTDESGRGVEPFSSLEEFAAEFDIPTEKLRDLRKLLTAMPPSIMKTMNININTAPPEVLYAIIVDADVVNQIVERQWDEERVFRNKAAIREVLVDMDPDVQGMISQVFDVRSSVYRLVASALTNTDPTGLTPGGIGQTISVLVQRRSRHLGSGRMRFGRWVGGGAQGNDPGEQEIIWTFRLLDWQKEGGARLFRSAPGDEMSPSEEEEKRDTSPR